MPAELPGFSSFLPLFLRLFAIPSFHQVTAQNHILHILFIDITSVSIAILRELCNNKAVRIQDDKIYGVSSVIIPNSSTVGIVRIYQKT